MARTVADTPVTFGSPARTAPEPGSGGAPRRPRTSPWASPEGWLTGGITVAAALFVLSQLQPSLLIADTTPAGGDMGAHVWAPAYLRDHLLPSLRLSGWTPDWYGGFPALHFYMVVPMLAIVVLDVAPAPVLAGISVPGAAATAVLIWWGRRRWRPSTLAGLAVAGGALSVALPYGVAFKVVSVAGLVAMPVAAAVAGRLAGLPFPGPPLLAVATVPFIFDRSFTIYGGNAASNLAGEFAFTISLTLVILYLGLLVDGLRTGRRRATTAVVLALAALCHIIPAIFAAVATVVAVVVMAGWRRLAWLVPVGVSALGLTAFWLGPFWFRRAYLNDMGWEELEPCRVGGAIDRSCDIAGSWLASSSAPLWGPVRWLVEVVRILVGGRVLPDGRDPWAGHADLRWVAALAAVGLVLAVVRRRHLGVIIGVTGPLFAWGFVGFPDNPIWNARLLPFWYLSLYLMAGLATAELIRTAAVAVAPASTTAAESVRRYVVGAGALAVTVWVIILVGVSLVVPRWGSYSTRTVTGGGTTTEVGVYTARIAGFTVSTTDRNFIPDWAAWNYSGYERKPAYPEYHAIVTTMDRIGRTRGCGRAMWEYSPDLDRYGTPMALMLLPHWTDGCIASMEGLYFEATPSVATHFLVQAELSASPSQPQRGLPYPPRPVTPEIFDRGIRHLQMEGVRYYMASSEEMRTLARDHPDLTEIASSGPWTVFEVADSPLVEGLAHEPAVVVDAPAGGDAWVDYAMEWWTDPGAWEVWWASGGPDGWQRIHRGEEPELRPLPEVSVTDISEGTHTIRFRVDRTGVPVVVKTSYFPSWVAEGAEGPWRVAPNLMVVVPTSEEVTLRFARRPLDVAAMAVTALSVVAVIAMARRDRRRRSGTPGSPAPDPSGTPGDTAADLTVVPAVRVGSPGVGGAGIGAPDPPLTGGALTEGASPGGFHPPVVGRGPDDGPDADGGGEAPRAPRGRAAPVTGGGDDGPSGRDDG